MNLFEILTAIYAVDTTYPAQGRQHYQYSEARALAGSARAEALARGVTVTFNAIRSVANYLHQAAVRHSTYNQLMRLDDRLLRDIGVDRSAIPHVAAHLAASLSSANDNRHVRAA